MIQPIVDRLLAMKPSRPVDLKYESEFNWWRNCAVNIIQWHMGQAESVWGHPPNDPPSKSPDLSQAVMSLKCAMSDTYPSALQMPETPKRQSYGRLLDLGCGPLCPATCFQAEAIVGADPLIFEYARIGYPLELYNTTCINIRAEDLSKIFESSTFDTIVSHNAIDHMDSLSEIAAQVQKLGRPGSLIRLSITCRKATVTEPLEITDDDVLKAFAARPLDKMTERDMGDHRIALWGTDYWRSS